MDQSREPLSYAGVNRIRFKGSDSEESSQFVRTPLGPYRGMRLLDSASHVNIYDGWQAF